MNPRGGAWIFRFELNGRGATATGGAGAVLGVQCARGTHAAVSARRRRTRVDPRTEQQISVRSISKLVSFRDGRGGHRGVRARPAPHRRHAPGASTVATSRSSPTSSATPTSRPPASERVQTSRTAAPRSRTSPSSCAATQMGSRSLVPVGPIRLCPDWRVGRAHCCARPPSEPDVHVSAHPAQASPLRLVGGQKCRASAIAAVGVYETGFSVV
jgi:hypothetical protein